jgi:hypothetical protein
LTGVDTTHEQSGWTAGGGIEWAFADNWTAKVKYLFVDLGNRSVNCAKIACLIASGGPAIPVTIGLTENFVRARRELQVQLLTGRTATKTTRDLFQPKYDLLMRLRRNTGCSLNWTYSALAVALAALLITALPTTAAAMVRIADDRRQHGRVLVALYHAARHRRSDHY